MAENKPKEFTPQGSANPETRGGKMGSAVWSEEYKAWMLPEVEVEGKGKAFNYSGRGENPIIKTRNTIVNTMRSFYPNAIEEELDPAQQAQADFLKRQQEMLDRVLGIAAIEARTPLVLPKDEFRFYDLKVHKPSTVRQPQDFTRLFNEQLQKTYKYFEKEGNKIEKIVQEEFNKAQDYQLDYFF